MSALEPTHEADRGGVAADVQLLLFQIGQERYGTDATQILRVGRPGPRSERLADLEPPASGRRTLVVERDGEQRELLIDAVVGVATAPIRQLRKLPAAVRAAVGTLGLWLDDGPPVLLLDLSEALGERPAASAT